MTNRETVSNSRQRQRAQFQEAERRERAERLEAERRARAAADAADVAAILAAPVDAVLGPGTVEERMRRFREYALRVHPDKCADPRAADAFKHLQAAKDLIQSSQK